MNVMNPPFNPNKVPANNVKPPQQTKPSSGMAPNNAARSQTPQKQVFQIPPKQQALQPKPQQNLYTVEVNI